MVEREGWQGRRLISEWKEGGGRKEVAVRVRAVR